MTKEQTIRFSEDECITLKQVASCDACLRDRAMHIPMTRISLQIMRGAFERVEEKTQFSLAIIDQAIEVLEKDDV